MAEIIITIVAITIVLVGFIKMIYDGHKKSKEPWVPF
jgi:hypothetical protein